MRLDAMLAQAGLIPRTAPLADGPAALSRRGFLTVTAAAGGGMLLSLWAPGALAADAAPAKKPIVPLPFVRIHPDNHVEIYSNRLEFGQGTQTALPMLIAEELDVPMSAVTGLLAPAGDAYRDPMFGIQMTGGSTALAHSWQQYREIGAAMRLMLMQAAAQRWQVPLSAVRTQAGYCIAGKHRASYGELADAAAALPVPEQVQLKNARDYKIIGKPTRRLDAPDAATGRKQFGIDVALDKQVVALLAHPPTFGGGKVASFNADKAQAIKGVRGVLEVPTDRGGSGVAVFADRFWAAKQARDALQISWTPGASAGLSSPQLLAEFRQMAAAPKALALDWQQGGSMARLDGAAKKIVAEYEFPYLAHAPMEPLNCTIDLSELADGKCRVWVGSQFQSIDQMAVASVVGLKPEQVTLHTMPAGGGFGRRAVPSSDYLREAAGVAKAWYDRGHKQPVKVMWTREDDIRGGYYRPMNLHRVEIGFDADGHVAAWDHVIVGQSIIKGTPFESAMIKNGVDATAVEGVVENDYGLPMRLRVTHPDLPIPVLWYRSVGHTHTAFVMETLIDEAAHTAGLDPVAYRLALFERRSAPMARHSAALQLAVAKSGYGKKKLPKDQAWGVAVHESFGTVVAHVVEVSVRDKRPVVHKITAGVHCNRVVNPLTASAQIEGAAVFGLSMTLPGNAITLKNGEVEQSQFSDYTPARIPDAPLLTEVHFVPSEDPPTGLGEPGTCGIAPAVANAVAALTGQRLRKLPFELA